MATKRWSSKTMRIRPGWLRGSIYWVLLFWGRFAITKPLSQIQRSTFSTFQMASYTHSFGGFGLRLPDAEWSSGTGSHRSMSNA